MRARQARRHALTLSLLLSTVPSLADGPTAPKPAPVEPTPPARYEAQAPSPASWMVAPAEVARERLATEARLRSLADPEAKEKPATRPTRELLEERRRLLGEWEKVARERAEAEHPARSPEAEVAENKADLERSRALLEQASKAPESILPESFQAPMSATASEARLGEMKEAIDSARAELKERAADLEALRAEGARELTSHVARERAERDKAHQVFVGLASRKGERESAVQAAASAEAREMARDRLVNFEWDVRIAAERLAAAEARIALAGRRLDAAAAQIQARAARVQLARTVLERMESRYSAHAERQRVALKRAVAKEETRAAQSGDPIEKARARRTAELLELESQVVAYEKAYATSGGVSLQEQTALADATVGGYAELQKMLNDGSVSPLDVLRLKNDFRRIGPERAQIVRTDLAASDAELIAYENALTDAEIDLVNDSRDDRFDRETLLEQMPEARRAEASAMLDGLETQHRALLNRRRSVLQKLAGRAEEAHKQVARRIETLDQEYAFIRTHIFWIRDAEPLGGATVAHARDEAARTARALAHLALESTDRSLWGRASADFVAALVALAVLPWPLRLGQGALDRLRLGDAPAVDPGRGGTAGSTGRD